MARTPKATPVDSGERLFYRRIGFRGGIEVAADRVRQAGREGMIPPETAEWLAHKIRCLPPPGEPPPFARVCSAADMELQPERPGRKGKVGGSRPRKPRKK